MQDNKAIIIGSYFGREAWASDCVNSLQGYTRYPVLIVNIPWELNVIKWVYDNTHLDEWLFLQDSVIVKDYEWIDWTFDQPGSVSLSHKPYFMYLGKYERLPLMFMNYWPEVTNKRDAVTYEGEWTSKYRETANTYTFYTHAWNLDDTEVYEFRHGRQNKVLENDHIIKYKGTWSPDMVPE